MCMAIPSQVIAIDGPMASVESFGVRRSVSLILLDEPVAVGDYLIVQAGQFAAAKMTREDALLSLDFLREVLESDSST